MLLILSLVLQFSAHAAVEKEIQPQKYVLCKNHSIVRTIRVEAKSDGCEAKYTKAGVDRTIGYGSHPTSCNKFVDNVKGNLEDASWSCRTLNDSSITAEAPALDEE